MSAVEPDPGSAASVPRAYHALACVGGMVVAVGGKWDTLLHRGPDFVSVYDAGSNR